LAAVLGSLGGGLCNDPPEYSSSFGFFEQSQKLCISVEVQREWGRFLVLRKQSFLKN
jgi:hypothetical protein